MGRGEEKQADDKWTVIRTKVISPTSTTDGGQPEPPHHEAAAQGLIIVRVPGWKLGQAVAG